MDNLKKLDEILLSNDARQNFYEEYIKNADFKSWLLNFLPEIEDCEKQQQNNPWHKYNVLGHILHSVEAMNSQTVGLEYNDRKLLAYTMLLHDIGKPAKHITRKKDGKVIDSFFDHNIESEKVAKRVLGKFGFSKEEILQIASLVNKHDIFMFIKDYKPSNPYHKQLTMGLIENEIKQLNLVGNGEDLFKKLVLVGRADNLAQNEQMTEEPLRLLAQIDKMLITRERER